MPTYEYRCLACRKRFDVFLSYRDYESYTPRCPHCQSEQVQRRIGRIRIAHSSETRLETMADPENLAALDDDPRALGRMMREMSSEIGEEMGPEFDEVVNRLEKGQSPEQIERDLPELGDAAGGDLASGGDDWTD